MGKSSASLSAQWLLIEAIQAYSESRNQFLDQISVVETFEDSAIAMKCYAEFHQVAPEREMYVFHTDRESLDISERVWVGA